MQIEQIEQKDSETIELTNTDELDDHKTKKGPSSCLLVLGDHGVGKTTAVNVILNQYNYDIQTLNFEILKINKNLDNYMDKIFNTDNIVNILKKQTTKNVVIVIDDLESILSANEKSIVSVLAKIK